MEKIVCFDIDDTLVNFCGHFIKFVAKQTDDEKLKKMLLSHGCNKWTSWAGYKGFGMTDEQFSKYLNEFYLSGEIRKMRPYNKDTAKLIKSLRDSGWTIWFVTKRNPVTIWQTAHQLRYDLGIEFDKLFCVGWKDAQSMVYDYKQGTVEETIFKSKIDVFSVYGVWAVFDDAEHYIEDAIVAEVPFIYMINRVHNQNWRKRNKGKFPVVRRVGPSGNFLENEIEELKAVK